MTRRPNIVWVTLDSLRYDHTTMSGYQRDTTQNLARIASRRQGSSHSRCFAHSNYTLASVPSILTGTYPGHHGVGMGVNERLPDTVPTVAERMSAAGYDTGCLSEIARVSEATGLDRGFDWFEYTRDRGGRRYLASKLRAGISHLFNNVLRPGGLREDRRGLTNGVGIKYTYQLARRYVDRIADTPFFLYIHNVGPHYPYRPPLSFLDRFTDEIQMSTAEALEFTSEVFEDNDAIERHIAEGCAFSEAEWEAIEAMYDADIAYSDHCVGRLFAAIRSMDTGPTVFVVTSDHGDLFGEHDLIAHRLVLDDALTHVPLVTHGLDEIADIDQDAIIQHADLMTTFVASAGRDTAGMHGVDLRTETRSYAISQRGPHEFAFENLLTYNDAFEIGRFHESGFTSIRDEEFRFERGDQMARLFELPDETTDVSTEYPEIRAEFEDVLEHVLEEIGAPVEAGEDADFTPKMEEQLRDLGYT